MARAGVGPVTIETTIRFQRELRLGDDVVVSCDFEFGSGKRFRVRQRITRVDGTPCAEIESVGGLLDLQTRWLVPDPERRRRELAERPELLVRSSTSS